MALIQLTILTTLDGGGRKYFQGVFFFHAICLTAHLPLPIMAWQPNTTKFIPDIPSELVTSFIK